MPRISPQTLDALNKLAGWQPSRKTGFHRGGFVNFEVRRARWLELLRVDADFATRSRLDQQSALRAARAAVEREAPFSADARSSHVHLQDTAQNLTTYDLWNALLINSFDKESIEEPTIEAAAATRMAELRGAGAARPSGSWGAWRKWSERLNKELRDHFRSDDADFRGSYQELIAPHLGPGIARRGEVQDEVSIPWGVLLFLGEQGLVAETEPPTELSPQTFESWQADAISWRGNHPKTVPAGRALLGRLMSTLGAWKALKDHRLHDALTPAAEDCLRHFEAEIGYFIDVGPWKQNGALRISTSRSTDAEDMWDMWDYLVTESEPHRDKALAFFSYGASESPKPPLERARSLLRAAGGDAARRSMAGLAAEADARWRARDGSWTATLLTSHDRGAILQFEGPSPPEVGTVVFVAGAPAQVGPNSRASYGESALAESRAFTDLPSLLLAKLDGEMDVGIRVD